MHMRGISPFSQVDCVLNFFWQTLHDLPSNGNFLLNNLSGAHQYLVGPKEQYATGLLPRAQKLAEKLRQDRGRKAYIIPVGGSDAVGVFGYFVAFDEIQKVRQN